MKGGLGNIDQGNVASMPEVPRRDAGSHESGPDNTDFGKNRPRRGVAGAQVRLEFAISALLVPRKVLQCLRMAPAFQMRSIAKGLFRTWCRNVHGGREKTLLWQSENSFGISQQAISILGAPLEERQHKATVLPCNCFQGKEGSPGRHRTRAGTHRIHAAGGTTVQPTIRSLDQR